MHIFINLLFLIFYIILDMTICSAECPHLNKSRLHYPNCTNPLCEKCLKEDPSICLACRRNTTIIDCEDRCVVSCQKRIEPCPSKTYAPWKKKEFDCCQRCFDGCNSGCDGKSKYAEPGGCFDCIYAVVEYDQIGQKERYRCLKPFDKNVCEFNNLHNYFLDASSDTEKASHECKPCDTLCSRCTSLGIEEIKHGCNCNATIATIEEKNGTRYCKPKHLKYETIQIQKEIEKLNKKMEIEDIKLREKFKTLTTQINTKRSNFRMLINESRVYGNMEDIMKELTSLEKNETRDILTSTVVNQREEKDSTINVANEDENFYANLFFFNPFVIPFLFFFFLLILTYILYFVIKAYNIHLLNRRIVLSTDYDRGHGQRCIEEAGKKKFLDEKNRSSDMPSTSSTVTTFFSGSLKSPLSASPTKQICIIKDVRKIKLLGYGAFGKVYQGKWFDGSKEIDVAIKIFKIHSKVNLSEKERKKLIQETQVNALKETSIMWKLQHPHIHRILGINLEREVEIVTELRLGSLKDYLSKNEKTLYYFHLINYCKQIASAMNYLHEQRIIHGDLSARNVLVKDQDHVEVSDFGFANMLKGDNPINSELIPSRWCAPECILSHNFTKENDVWAYGVLCWEIFTYGNKTPYKSERLKNDMDLLDFLENNNLLQKPTACSNNFYIQIMLGCWIKKPEARMNFNQIVINLDGFSN